MKSYRRVVRRGRRLTVSLRRLSRHHRKGTVIIVVLALLGMLLFTGIFAIAFTASENQNATYFANSPSAKVIQPDYANPDAYFYDVLRQVVIGPAISERQSALWGGTKSLLPTMFGRDMAPYNGQGINVIWNSSTNQPAVDLNCDAVPDNGNSGQANNVSLLNLNLSPAAQGVLNITGATNALLDLNNFPNSGTPFPEPDTNTTYPDINSAFLSYDAMVPNGAATVANPTGGTPVRVIIPSYHRPQLLRNATSSLGGNVTPSQWYTDKATATLVMHPHAEHLVIDSNGNLTTVQRFVTNAHPDTTTNPLYPFPLAGDNPSGAQYVQPTVQEGIWSNGTVPGDPINFTGLPGQLPGVDTDKDGVMDSFYMDFGFPMMTTPTGQQYVALAAVKIVDADPLLNLNVHGNRGGQVALGSNAPTPFGGVGPTGGSTTQMISTSNQGVSASEVNPEWALNARPALGSADLASTTTNVQLVTAFQQNSLFFRTPANSGTLPTDDHSQNNFELANEEWWNILVGRPQLTAGTNPTTNWPTVSGSSLPGRWGENAARLDSAVANIVAGSTAVVAGAGTADPFPQPGTSGVDDNNNAPEGGTYIDEQSLLHPSFVQPLDFFAAGYSVQGADGKIRARRTRLSELRALHELLDQLGRCVHRHHDADHRLADVLQWIDKHQW